LKRDYIKKTLFLFIWTLVVELPPNFKPYSLCAILSVVNHSENKVWFSGGNMATKVEQKNKVLNVRNEQKNIEFCIFKT